MVINYRECFGTSKLKELQPRQAESRIRWIRAGPLFDLQLIQDYLRSGEFDLDQLHLANTDVVKDLQREGWRSVDVLQMLANMKHRDYRKSEWAMVEQGRRWVPCDVYHTYYDAAQRIRHARAVPVYLKFSVERGGWITLVVASCHASA